MSNWKSFFGPSTLIAAAFVGPGTVTTCTLAGIKHQYELLWALWFSAAATIVLQEMAARLGWVTGEGLGEAVRRRFGNSAARWLVFGLVIGAIFVGNAAYESGNISGASLGMNLLLGDSVWWALIAGLMTFALLLAGYQWVEKFLIALVLLMSVCFFITAILVRPNLAVMLSGFIPRSISSKNLLTIMAVVGTTVVPYNLFLHASTISKKWGRDARLVDIRTETIVAVVLGVIVSLLIMVTSAATKALVENPDEIENAGQLAVQLQPVFGDLSKVLMGIGLLAAGLSSAITAPMAAAYAVSGLFGWSRQLNESEAESADTDSLLARFGPLGVRLLIVSTGLVVCLMGLNFIYLIQFAQITNALILPLIGGFMLLMANQKSVMGEHTNSWLGNLAGGLLLCVLSGLSAWTFYKIYLAYVG